MNITQAYELQLIARLLSDSSTYTENSDTITESLFTYYPDVFADAVWCAYNNQEIEYKLVEILQAATNDKHSNSWIEYWIYELEFGKKYKHGSVTNADKSIIDLSTSEKLYEFLITQ